MRAILAGLGLIWLASGAAAQQTPGLDAFEVENKHLGVTIDKAVDLAKPAYVLLRVRLPFPGAAATGIAQCVPQAIQGQVQRIRILCQRLKPGGDHGTIRIVGEVYGPEGLAGIPALKSDSGHLYTDRGGQSAILFVTRVIALEPS